MRRVKGSMQCPSLDADDSGEELNKRIANPPAQAVPSASARRYEFIGCYQTATGEF